MARRRHVLIDARDQLAELGDDVLRYMNRLGVREDARRQRAYLDRVREGRPVVVEHGYQIGLPPNSGPWLLTADDTLQEISR